ncbi:MAG: hypothetical protein ACRDHD_11765 [Candidatus Limnocylindria bacterium]
MSLSRRLALSVALGATLALGAALPAQAAIHEIVASWCSGADQGAVLDPPGQTRFGSQSFLRALQASGVYDVQFGIVPAGQPAPFPGTTPVTVEVDASRPNAKVDAVGGYFVFPVTEGGVSLTVYLSAVVPDHPAFAHCPNFPTF